jgi:hypothetical protein
MNMILTARPFRAWAGSCLLLMMAQGAAFAAQQPGAEDAPRLVNSERETQAATGGLGATLEAIARRSGPAWIGYSAARVAGQGSLCCGNHDDGERCGTCRLEGENQGVTGTGNDPVKLEGGHRLVVLLRLEGHKVTRIAVASEDCTLDAGGLHVVWLSNVDAGESVTVLSGYVLGAPFAERRRDDLGRQALTAIALHADAAADRALASFTAPQQSEELRKKASFWLGEARGAAGLAMLRSMAKNDPSGEVRAQVTFALSVSREPGALDEMIRMAREDGSGQVRGQALFWLSQKAGKRALGAISGAIADDPETDVKKKAVFALSQLPKDEGVPKLIEVATSNRNAEVRKQAMFWLGQSNDPRALDFFAKVLAQ